MKDLLILFGLLIAFVLISFIIVYQNQSTENNSIVNNSASQKHEKVRCLPKYLDARNKPKDYDIRLYEETKKINNKGFVNELIYKPEQTTNEVHFVSGFTKNDVPLNMHDDEIIDTSLPIANINVNYLLQNSTKLK